MQVGLTQHIHTSFMVSGEESRRKKRVMIARVMSNDDVLFHWNNLAIDIRAVIRGLLGHIIELWLTIRGFSISKAWMDKNKRQVQAKTTKKN